MFCDQCGTENPNQNKYCGECGAKLDSANGKTPEPLHTPVGPVSSAFRREVEQQQLRLQRLEEQPVRSYSDLATSSAESAPDSETIVNTPRPLSEEPTVVGKLEHAHYERTDDTISGPSFLGLSGPEPTAQQDLSYLYEDAANPGRARKLLALVIVLGFIAFIAYEWKQNPNWQTTIVGKLRKPASTVATSTPPPQGASTQQSPTSASAPSPSTNTAPDQEAPKNNTSNAPEQTQRASQEPAAPPVASTQPAATDSTNSKTPDADSAEGQSSAAEASAETNSTGAAGEQESVDSGNTGKTATHATERASMKKRAAQSSAAPKPAKAEEPDEALVKKAEAYLYGRGVAKNCQQALVYLRTAANRGNAMARSKLGGLYATGHCVPLDRAEAYNWFTLSRDAGANNVWVQRNREILWSKMTADERARAMEPPR